MQSSIVTDYFDLFYCDPLTIISQDEFKKSKIDDRQAGVLLHISSLPGRYGIGDLGLKAYEFIDFLKKSGQKYWQTLPFNHPVDRSPYKCYSAFAGNPLFIDPEYMCKRGWLSEKDLKDIPLFSATKVEFSKVKKFKMNIFKQAYRVFNRREKPSEYKRFLLKNNYWLEDYCLFMALTDYFKGSPWPEWPADIAGRQEKAIRKYSKMLADKIDYYRFLQYVFLKQWREMKLYARKSGIKIVGDIPCFVAHNSSDVWVHTQFFDLDREGNPLNVAGVPPDYFSETGQYWGNPLYNWDKMAKDNYRWWRQRIAFLELMVDVLRIDHFRGFDAFWEIPAEEETAVNGQWVKGPGADFFAALKTEIERLEIIAENLGHITESVEKLRINFDLPGMKVMQFLIEPDSLDQFFISLHQRNNFLYTGTHDNETLWQWIVENSDKPVKKINYNKAEKEKNCWQFIEKAYLSWAETVIIPLQDFLHLGREGRMNIPGTIDGNWEWRFTEKQLEGMAGKIKSLVEKYFRK